jgi:DNA polymerase-3 subunit alpha
MLFLDLKSHYSIKKAFGSPETVVEKAKALGANHCALTDYDSISGCISFVKACKEASIKPILGCTFSVTEGGRLTVLAKNLDGWKALLKAVSLSYTKEFYDATNERPYLSIAKLKELGKDWIAIIGIPGDILCKRIFRDYVPYHQKTSEIIENTELDPVGTLETLHKELLGSFHKVLVGISPNNTDFTNWMNQVIGDSTFKKVGLTNSHYPEETDYTYFRLQMCSHLKSTKNHWMKVAEQREPELLKFKENSWYLRKLESPNLELSEEFCDYEILSPPKLPTFECPNGKSPNEYLRELCRIGWKKLLTPDVLRDKQDVYLARIKEELDVIEDAGLASYFLIVADFIRYTISLGGLTSPGRGSVGGSLIAYLTGITRINPIEYGLLFSRFFSSARKGSMPDIDVDFPTGMREEVVEYVRNKYGRDKVCHIATFSEIKGATAIKEVLRINDVCGFEQMNEITKAIPEEGKIADQMESSGISSILEWTLRHMPDRLKDYARYDGDELVGDYAEWFRQAINLEGTIQGTGKHASALVVFDSPLHTVCPMIADKSSDEPIAGYSMSACESAGMIKFDFLGLASLDRLLETNVILKTRSAYYRSLHDKGI